MTEEIKNQEVQNECVFKCKSFKKFVCAVIASFVGTYLALSLFVALHKPHIPPMGFRGMHHKMIHVDNMNKSHFKRDFNHEQFNKEFKKDFEKVQSDK